MNKKISDWNIVNDNLHRLLIVLSVPLLLLILWQLYTSDKVVEVMRSNDLVVAVFMYFFMIAVEIGVLAFILRVGRTNIWRHVFGIALIALPFVWILFNSLYSYYQISIFGLALFGPSAYFLSVIYSVVILLLVYQVFVLPYAINSGVALSSIERSELNEKASSESKVSKKTDSVKSGSKSKAGSKAKTESKSAIEEKSQGKIAKKPTSKSTDK